MGGFKFFTTYYGSAKLPYAVQLLFRRRAQVAIPPPTGSWQEAGQTSAQGFCGFITSCMTRLLNRMLFISLASDRIPCSAESHRTLDEHCGSLAVSALRYPGATRRLDSSREPRAKCMTACDPATWTMQAGKSQGQQSCPLPVCKFI